MSPDNSNRTMRDAFAVWNVGTVGREVVLRNSDDQHVAVPLPDGERERFERLEGSGTVEATLARTDGGPTAWRIESIHGVEE